MCVGARVQHYSIAFHAAKFNPTDTDKIHACGEHYANHIDFDALLAVLT